MKQSTPELPTGDDFPCSKLVRTPSIESIDNRLPPRRINWLSAAWIVNAAVVGVGVLTIPQCLAKLGWLVGGISLLLCLLANLYCAYIMLEVRNVYPLAISMPDAMGMAFESKNMKQGLRVVLYCEKTLCTCTYVTLAAHTLGSAFNNVHWCQSSWLILVLAFLMLFSWVKNFNDTGALNLINIGTITIAVFLVCVWAFKNGSLDDTNLGPQANTSLTDIFGALAQIVFAFNGNWMYFEIMSEMERPHEFMKSMGVAGSTQLFLYVTIGAFGYAFLGGQQVPGSIIDALSFGPMMSLVVFLVVVHIGCGTVTNMVAVTRFFHSRASPKTVNDSTVAAQCIRSAVFFAVVGFACLVSIMIPSFVSLVRLIGAVFEAPISFVCPFAIYAASWRQNPERLRNRAPRLTLGIGALIAAFGFLIMVLGTASALHEIGNNPLSACNCAGMWNTCECSASRMLDQCPHAKLDGWKESQDTSAVGLGELQISPQRSYLPSNKLSHKLMKHAKRLSPMGKAIKLAKVALSAT